MPEFWKVVVADRDHIRGDLDPSGIAAAVLAEPGNQKMLDVADDNGNLLVFTDKAQAVKMMRSIGQDIKSATVIVFVLPVYAKEWNRAWTDGDVLAKLI